MELYHIHLINNHDRMYKPGNEIIIDKNKFNNRLYKRCMNLNFGVKPSDYKKTCELISQCGWVIDNNVQFPMILDYMQGIKDPVERNKALLQAFKMMSDAMVAKRELSLESYRVDNCPDKPSRLHSMYACSEEGINYWLTRLIDNDVEVFRIDALDEVFVTNEQLLPNESTSYLESYNKAVRYFNPKQKNLGNESDEILVQGKVKILEKVDERKNK